ncbi:MAG: metallophosphoesterase [Bacteroidales bacterium]|jgi:hypothetical protein|nr:metallophosphoesterase [Bacteroidales bacterium]
MRRIFFLQAIYLCFFTGLHSQIPDNDNFLVTHGPWLQNMGAGGVTVIWTTNKPAIPGIVLTLPDGSSRLVRNSTDGIIDGGGILHKVRVDGLQPGTSYKYNLHSVQVLKYQAYKVYYGDTVLGKSISFSTFPAAAPDVDFTVFNDVHGLSGKMASYLRHNDIKAQDFYFFNGDMMDWLQDTEELYGYFLDSAAYYFASLKPFFYVRGNHETRGFAARELKKWFDFRDDRFYYGFDHGPVHFTVLDCGEDKPDNNRYYYGLADYDVYRLRQLEWLKEEVKSEAFRKAKFRIVMVHMPIQKAEKQNHAMTMLSKEYGPVLQGAGIDLMISAHIHRNAFLPADKSGFGYALLVNSNNSYVEVKAGPSGLTAHVRDISGKTVSEYKIK